MLTVKRALKCELIAAFKVLLIIAMALLKFTQAIQHSLSAKAALTLKQPTMLRLLKISPLQV